MTRSLVFEGARALSVRHASAATLGPADVRLLVEACGVCGSDLASYAEGHYAEPGQVLGHEIAAVVTEVGTHVSEVGPGQRVAVRPLRGCGTCWYCTAGAEGLCGQGARHTYGYGRPGGFADELVVTAPLIGTDLIPVAGDVAADDLLWAEPLAVVLHAIGRLQVGPGARVAVVGTGPLGLASVAALTAGGCETHVLEPRDLRRAAAVRLGAVTATDTATDLPRVDGVVEASGRPAGYAAAVDSVAPGGTVVLLGLGDQPIQAPPPLVRVRGAFAYDVEEFRRAVRLIQTGRIRLGALVTHHFDLDQADDAMTIGATDDSVIKVAFTPNARRSP